MLPLPFLPYEGGPTIIEWLNQICQKFNELLMAVKNVRELPPGGTHGQVATPKEDGSGYEWANQSGGGSDDLWYPTVTTAGIISWAKSNTTTPPASRNIKGPKGNDGTPGKDGVSPTANVVQTETGATITVTDASGTTTAKIKNGTPGAPGAPGTPGTPGKDGVSPTANVVQTETGATITVTDASGTTTAKIKNGTPGAPGAPGTPGTPGKDGITPTFEVGTVTKLSPDAEPTVTLENVGGGLYMIDYGIPQGQPGTPGTGSGDVVAAGNNVFTGTNRFEGLTVLGETHAETPTNNNDVTNKLYVDTLAGTTKTSAVTEADEHTDNKISALRTLPAGGTSGQVPTIASDGESVEWKTPSGGGGGGGGGGVEWVEVTIPQLDSSNLIIDNLKLWYDKNDHQHLKFEGYIWATIRSAYTLYIKMPDDFSPVVTDMWAPLLTLAGTNPSIASTVTLYVQYLSSHKLKIYPSGSDASWLANRRYAVGSEIYLNPSQLIQSISDEVNDEIDIHTSDDAGTQHSDGT